MPRVGMGRASGVSLAHIAANLVIQGLYDSNDLATQTVPLAYTGGAAALKLTNDAAGPATNEAYPLPGVSNPWDKAANEFDWSETVLGDTVDVRPSFEVITSAPNQVVTLRMVMAGGLYDLTLQEVKYDAAGAHPVSRWFGVYEGDEATRTGASYFTLESPDDFTVKVSGWYTRIIPRRPKVG